MKCVTAKLVLVTLLAASVLAEEEQEEAVELDKKITKLQIGSPGCRVHQEVAQRFVLDNNFSR